MPMAGTGPQPKIRSGDSGISSTSPTVATPAGTAMLPVPRITADSALKTQMTTAPANTQPEYTSAASSDAPVPPMRAYSARPKTSSTTVNRAPNSTAITSAWTTSALASSLRREPSARAIAEAMPPPMAPADIICMSITAGNTSAMPASASVPSLPTNQVSISPAAACASMSSTLGRPRRASVGAMGPSSSTRVRGSIAALVIGRPPCVRAGGLRGSAGGSAPRPRPARCRCTRPSHTRRWLQTPCHPARRPESRRSGA